MPYQKGDEKGYFTKVVAALVLIAIAGSIFVYSIASNNSGIENEIEVSEQNGAATVDPSGNGPFPTTDPTPATP